MPIPLIVCGALVVGALVLVAIALRPARPAAPPPTASDWLDIPEHGRN